MIGRYRSIVRTSKLSGDTIELHDNDRSSSSLNVYVATRVGSAAAAAAVTDAAAPLEKFPKTDAGDCSEPE